jgi:hypothetical protein
LIWRKRAAAAGASLLKVGAMPACVNRTKEPNMASAKQRAAARKNVKKAQARWRAMSRRQHARSQPQGGARKRPGTGGGGKFFRIEVRPGTRFASYRMQTLGRPGHTKRLAGRTAQGTWATKSWLVAKSDARMKGSTLVIVDARAKRAIAKGVRGPIRHFKGDIFRAKPRRDVPEGEKPTPAMRRAQRKNIKKAQRAWRRLHRR